ncbi:hypothetical protein B0P06_005249 [Clostridium saccharoperbutylacetonicum]|uniref:Uncharacterized protein n=1 Tax=Clostridium saccharoperbutylacetonicum N1-4(HMT) TaxID=931276 RepID=M1MYJ0_9CLOT|nr:hypothetical protein [Clostridium saccharoperbutylacetonicum]AGF56482.1 hypothetical protein Cspa_c27170 [Clostridium saccharoperbutylacetonicum N1-4(HMT)]NRT62771.1 hypothetical protein [Clostridium saccharoperbutylacetonicum]NSB26123.1 hypothetical protein [Clostridium saccharoperbutylacetonicum]NSB45478.1 hypothetical protein [Clostridium saccharoperbutylacetonicum]
MDTKKLMSQKYVQVIISKSTNKKGDINAVGTTLIAISISLILLFFFMLGYSFFYGIYFGNGKDNISLLEIGLNIIPIEPKFAITLGVSMFIISTLFIIPIKNFVFKRGVISKLIYLLLICFFSIVSIGALKASFRGTVLFNFNDIYMIYIPLIIPLLIFFSLYIADCLLKKRFLFIISLIITIPLIKIVISQIINYTKFDLRIWLLLFLLSVIMILIIDDILELISNFFVKRPFIKLNKEINTVISFFTSFISLIKESKLTKIAKKIKLRLDIVNINKSINWDELMLSLIMCIAIMAIISAPSIYASLGSFYGTNYVSNNTQIITYSNRGVEFRKIGYVIGCKDGNYYISEHPNRNLLIIKASEVTIESHIIGWQNIKDKWYYFNSDGEILINAETPDGYKVDETGAWIK